MWHYYLAMYSNVFILVTFLNTGSSHTKRTVHGLSFGDLSERRAILEEPTSVDSFPARSRHRRTKHQNFRSKPMKALATLAFSLHAPLHSLSTLRSQVPTLGYRVGKNLEFQSRIASSRLQAIATPPRNIAAPALNTRFKLDSAAFVLPHPDKADRRYELPPHCGGEDAFFIESDAGVMGIADGVGSWSSRGIDPGKFSRQLMNFAAEAARAGIVDPVDNLRAAHDRTTELGSATALVLSVVPSKDLSGKTRLMVANLGDSGFLHLRHGQVLLKSYPQQSRFNCPYQLYPPGIENGSPHHAYESDIYLIEDLEDGDLVVLGTDGLLDNVFAADIAEIAFDTSDGGKAADTLDPALIAKKIAQHAEALSIDSKWFSPFSVDALANNYMHIGGKSDDITVVVAVVRKPKMLP